MKTTLCRFAGAVALVGVLPMSLALAQTGATPAQVQAAQKRLQLIDITAEQRLTALRQSLLQTAMEGPTEVKTTQWIDQTGALRESSSFTSGMVVRGVRVLNEPSTNGAEKVQLKEKQAVVEKTCERSGHERASPWHHVTLDVAISPHLGATNRFTAQQITRELRQQIHHRTAQSPNWRVSDKVTYANPYEKALLTQGEQNLPWRLNVLVALDPQSTPVNPTYVLRWEVSHRQDRALLLSQQHWVTLPPTGGGVAGLDPVVSAQIQAVVETFHRAMETQLSCVPPQFEAQLDQGKTLRINAGHLSGLRLGDVLVVADRQKIPARILEPGSLEGVTLAEVRAVYAYSAELKTIAGVVPKGAAQWVAVPYTP
jgi:hypothetical protein